MNSYKSRLLEHSASQKPNDLASSNLSQFLEHTMPSVPAQFLPKSCLWDSSKRCRSTDTESVPFYCLGDMWESYDEWSAYGAGVPLLLNGEDTVVQYYVPYLSALQLYVRSAARPHLRFRKLGEESDASSECSSDGENELGNYHNRSRSFNWQSECTWREYTRKDLIRRCSSLSTVEDELMEDDENCGGELLFEYFEEAVPYSRIPLVDKISSLTHQSLELTTLRSVDLLPTSWMSIAWYPIYRIPTGPTLQDLAACFLTFHMLGTPLEGGHHYNKGSCRNGLRSDKYVLPSFGLASYKLRGSLWTSVESVERRLAGNLQGTAESWLKKLSVRHPDFEFFVNNGGRC